MTSVQIGEHSLELGSDDLVELRDSSDIIEDEEALRDRLDNEGYLFIRGFHDADVVQEARTDVLEHMSQEGLLHPDEPVEKGVIPPDADTQFETFDMTGESWTHYPSLQKLAEGDTIMDFFDRLLGEESIVFDRKLGRAKKTGDFTGFHVDRVFMGTGTTDRYTVWQPIGDCPVDIGPLLICPESANHQQLRETYGQIDVGKDPYEAHFSKDPYDVIETIGGPLATANFHAGDVIIFDQFMLHGALSNQTDRWRISIDTRYQSIWEPADPRWIGAETTGSFVRDYEDRTPMTDLRAEWGI